MNPIFLKQSGFQNGFKYSKGVTDRLVNSLLDSNDSNLITDMELKLHKWSVESTLAALYGSQYNLSDKSKV